MLHLSNKSTTMRQPKFSHRLISRLPILLVLALPSLQLQARPLLHCDITYAGTTHALDAHIIHDTDTSEAADTGGAYVNEASDIGGRFRFKALLLGSGQRLTTVKLYAYYESDRQPVLLQEVRYAAPFKWSATPNSLTGLNYLYSPQLGRELQYGCALTEKK